MRAAYAKQHSMKNNMPHEPYNTRPRIRNNMSNYRKHAAITVVVNVILTFLCVGLLVWIVTLLQ
jgi:hypothetical protein